MFAAYLDESGTHGGSKVIVVAALVSPVEQWEQLTRSWERVLAEKGLPDFHTVDCAHRRGAFEDWSREDCSKLYIRLVNLTKRHVLWRTWSAILVEEYLKFFREEKYEEALYHAYSICTDSSASRVRDLARQLDARIPCVFEQGGLGGRFAVRSLADALESGSSFSSIASVSFDTKQNLIPLQVADLHAYEVHKYFCDQVEQVDQEVCRVRRSLREIMRIPEIGGGGTLFDLPQLRTMFDAFRRGTEEAARRGDIRVDTTITPLTNDNMVRIRRAAPGEVA